jgi:hypothetical protein
VTKLRVIKFGKRLVALVTVARKSDIAKLFFVKLGERTKGSSPALPSRQSRVQSEETLYR